MPLHTVKQSISLVSLVVPDYDEAIAFYVGVLGFELVRDMFIPEENKRWVIVAPRGSNGCKLLLTRLPARAETRRTGTCHLASMR